MKLIKYLGYFTLLFIINSCSFYSLKGTIPAHINSVYIQPIINQSSDQDISDLIDDKLNNLLIRLYFLSIEVVLRPTSLKAALAALSSQKSIVTVQGTNTVLLPWLYEPPDVLEYIYSVEVNNEEEETFLITFNIL